ncbi:MAG: hypothetical protein MZW92_81385 [Comamonadaceae bacterium]|nr:hypothetical protein [Comamonadaceae bacterium]
MSLAFPDARLLIFAKAPVPGRVKTRLAGQLGTRGAAALYQKLLRRTLRIARAARLCLWCAPDAGHGFFVACRREYGVRLRRQCVGDLGQRMNHALNQTFATGHEAVLGPAADGGYVLIGPNPVLSIAVPGHRLEHADGTGGDPPTTAAGRYERGRVAARLGCGHPGGPAATAAVEFAGCLNLIPAFRLKLSQTLFSTTRCTPVHASCPELMRQFLPGSPSPPGPQKCGRHRAYRSRPVPFSQICPE